MLYITQDKAHRHSLSLDQRCFEELFDADCQD